MRCLCRRDFADIPASSKPIGKRTNHGLKFSAFTRAAFAGSLCAVGLAMATSSPALALSADAQKIVDQVVATIPDLKPVCSDRKKLRTAVSDATKTLAKGKKLEGEPKPAAQEAGKYLFTNCPPPQ